VPRIDILIDDGGHTPAQQIATLEELYLHIQPNGVYVCEDLHTSFMPEYGGGYLRPGTFLEYAKGLVDNFYGWYSREQERLAVNQFTSPRSGRTSTTACSSSRSARSASRRCR